MAGNAPWRDLGGSRRFTQQPLTPAMAGTTRLVITFVNGEFGALGVV